MSQPTKVKPGRKGSRSMRSFFRWALVAALLLVVMLCVYIVIDDSTVALTNYEYYNDHLPNAFYGYRVIVIADFHNAWFANQISAMINQESPDMVLFVGDMTSLPNNPTDNLEKLLNGITIDVPVYAVTGNHETFSADAQSVKARLKKLPMTLLENQKITITRDGESIDLLALSDTGMDDSELIGSWGLNEIREFIQSTANPNRFTLMACHRANMYPMLNDLSANLMISGHEHGGIVRLPVVGGLIGADGHFLPDYDFGFYQETDMTLLVSRGCDFPQNKLRVFNGPEVVQVTLKK